MNKRKRKKFHVGEYTEYGFSIGADVKLDNQSPEADQFCDDLIDFVEGRGCGVGGGIGSKVSVFCTRIERGSCTDEDREAVIKWLYEHPLVTNYEVGDLLDAWNASDEEYENG